VGGDERGVDREGDGGIERGRGVRGGRYVVGEDRGGGGWWKRGELKKEGRGKRRTMKREEVGRGRGEGGGS